MDNSLAIWLKDEDSDESKAAKKMLLAATNLRTTRSVRTLHELYDKITLFDDGLDDFEIELFKLGTCLREQFEMDLPFHYSGMENSFLGKKSLVFAIAGDGGFNTIKYSLQDFQSAVRPLVNKVRPLIDKSEFEWAFLDRRFVLRVMEDAS